MIEHFARIRERVNSSSNAQADACFEAMRGARRFQKELIFARGRNSIEIAGLKFVTTPAAFALSFVRAGEAINYLIAYRIAELTGGRKLPK
jgi:hypothetical protein